MRVEVVHVELSRRAGLSHVPRPAPVRLGEREIEWLWNAILTCKMEKQILGHKLCLVVINNEHKNMFVAMLLLFRNWYNMSEFFLMKILLVSLLQYNTLENGF